MGRAWIESIISIDVDYHYDLFVFKEKDHILIIKKKRFTYGYSLPPNIIINVISLKKNKSKLLNLSR